MVRRPLISSARETGRTTQSPIVAHPYLRKFRLPHPEEAAGPPRPRPPLSLPLEGWRAWWAWEQVGSDRLPTHGESGPHLRTRGHRGGRSEAGSGFSQVSEGGPREVTDELEGVRLETGMAGESGGRKPSSTRSNGHGAGRAALSLSFEPSLRGCTQPLPAGPPGGAPSSGC